MTIGERIKAKRIEMGWSQRELAKRMNYQNHSTVTKIEAGKVDLPQKRLEQFAKVLNTDVAYLMGWEEKTATNNDSGLSEAKLRLLDLAENCTEEEAERLLQMMKLFLNKQ